MCLERFLTTFHFQVSPIILAEHICGYFLRTPHSPSPLPTYRLTFFLRFIFYLVFPCLCFSCTSPCRISSFSTKRPSHMMPLVANLFGWFLFQAVFSFFICFLFHSLRLHSPLLKIRIINCPGSDLLSGLFWTTSHCSSNSFWFAFCAVLFTFSLSFFIFFTCGTSFYTCPASCWCNIIKSSRIHVLLTSSLAL
jgi:hypothetical protein